MRIQHNILAMNAYRNYTNNNNALAKNLEKLSSGYKINRAGDDAAGLAISEKMRAQITGLNAASKNAKDGISLVKTAEGALSEVHDMLNRMVSLATQSANGTYDNSTDRVQLQKEIDQLKAEINRIADSSNFNGIKLLDGSMDTTAINGVTYNGVSENALGSKNFFINGWDDDNKWKAKDQTGVGTNRMNKLETEGGASSKGGFQVSLDGIGTVEVASGQKFTLQIGSQALSFTAGGNFPSGKLTASLLAQALAKQNSTFQLRDANNTLRTFNVKVDNTGKGLIFSAIDTGDGAEDYKLNTSAKVTWGVEVNGVFKEGGVTAKANETNGPSVGSDYEIASANPAGGVGGPAMARETTAPFGQVMAGKTTTTSGAARYGVNEGSFAANANVKATGAITLTTGDKGSAGKIKAALASKANAAGASTVVAFSFGTTTNKIDVTWADLKAAIDQIDVAGGTAAIKTILADAINEAIKAKTANWGQGSVGKKAYKVSEAEIAFATNAVKITNVATAACKMLEAAKKPEVTIDFTGMTGKDVIGGTITIGTKTYKFVDSTVTSPGSTDIVIDANATAGAIARAFASKVKNNAALSSAATGAQVTGNTKVQLKGSTAGAAGISNFAFGGTVTTTVPDVSEPTSPTTPIPSGHAGLIVTLTFTDNEKFANWTTGDSVTFSNGSATITFTRGANGSWALSGSQPFNGYTVSFDGKYMSIVANASGVVENPPFNTEFSLDSYKLNGTTVSNPGATNIQATSGLWQSGGSQPPTGDYDAVGNQVSASQLGVNGFATANLGSTVNWTTIQSQLQAGGGGAYTFNVSTSNGDVDIDGALLDIMSRWDPSATKTLQDFVNALKDAAKEAINTWNQANGSTAGFEYDPDSVKVLTNGADGDAVLATEDKIWVVFNKKTNNGSTGITNGVIDTGIQNVTDNNLGAAAGVANTVVDFDAEDVKAWKDGAQIRIGDTTYTVAIGENSKFKNVKNVIDLTDEAYRTAKADVQKKMAAQRLTVAAKDNSIFIVGHDGEGHTTLQQRTEVKDSTDMSTKERLLSYLGVSIADADSIENAKAGEALTLQIGDTSESYNQLRVSIGDSHTAALGIDGIDISTQEGAAAAVDKIKAAINQVSDIRGSLGATQNRLEHTQNNLSVMVENIQDAESTIRDTDVAEEMMQYVKNNILIQSAQAMLAQANQIPQGVLQLLG